MKLHSKRNSTFVTMTHGIKGITCMISLDYAFQLNIIQYVPLVY